MKENDNFIQLNNVDEQKNPFELFLLFLWSKIDLFLRLATVILPYKEWSYLYDLWYLWVKEKTIYGWLSFNIKKNYKKKKLSEWSQSWCNHSRLLVEPSLLGENVHIWYMWSGVKRHKIMCELTNLGTKSKLNVLSDI